MIIGYLQNILIGKYINGYKIVKIEYDPFVKGQINIITDGEVIESPCNDRSIVIFRLKGDFHG